MNFFSSSGGIRTHTNPLLRRMPLPVGLPSQKILFRGYTAYSAITVSVATVSTTSVVSTSASVAGAFLFPHALSTRTAITAIIKRTFFIVLINLKFIFVYYFYISFNDASFIEEIYIIFFFILL